MVDRLRRVELFEAAVVQDRDSVSHRKRFLMVVGHQNCRRLGTSQQVVHIFPHLSRHVRIQIAERFVEQQDHRLLHQGSGQRDSLLLAP